MNWKKALGAVVVVVAVAATGWFGAALLLGPPGPRAPVPNPKLFANWAAIVVAGDWRAHSGAPSEVFDNARHDLVKKFVAIGFDPQNIKQFSAQPQKFPYDTVEASAEGDISTGLAAVTAKATAGCLLYFTSHGSPEGIVIGQRVVDPTPVATLINSKCGDRPTVVIVSACFSGTFVPLLQGPHRIVFTAASSYRTSFGCGEQDQYTFFDTCVLSQLDGVGNFAALADKVRACVTAREAAMGIKEVDPASLPKGKPPPDLPSQPQFVMDEDMAKSLIWK